MAWVPFSVGPFRIENGYFRTGPTDWSDAGRWLVDDWRLENVIRRPDVTEAVWRAMLLSTDNARGRFYDAARSDLRIGRASLVKQELWHSETDSLTYGMAEPNSPHGPSPAS